MCNSRLRRPRLRDITLLPHTVTDITLSRMAVALAAILVPYFGSVLSGIVVTVYDSLW